MAAPDPSARHHHKHEDPAAPATARTRRPSTSSVALLAGLAVNLVLCLRRVRDDRGAMGFVAFSHLNLLLLFGAIRWFDLAPPGSPARGRARLAAWLLTTTLTASFTWKIGEFLPLGFAIAAWAMSVATVLSGFYFMFLAGEK
ncbi:unnamed protein product [Urochloa decumbens]|uniref:Uncharacterized protein n=1 Tax=Urochloa decumbens TaxID=240449 RepID=A0ABC9DDK1_9POAL